MPGGGPFSCQGGSAGLYGLGNGFRFSIKDLSLRVGSALADLRASFREAFGRFGGCADKGPRSARDHALRGALRARYPIKIA
jgi:hypothetical protein